MPSARPGCAHGCRSGWRARSPALGDSSSLAASLDAVGGQHLERGRKRRRRQRMGVEAKEQRAIDAFLLRYSQIAWLIASTCHSLKLASSELAAMPRGAERHALRGHDGSGRSRSTR